MKTYLTFNLSGKKLLPLWILNLVFLIVPYVLLLVEMKNFRPGDKALLFIFPFFLLIIIIALVLVFYMARLVIENIGYNDSSVEFNGSFKKFIGMIIGGFLLTIISLGIYGPWFIKDLHKFFINNSKYNSEYFSFEGSGGKLLLTLLLSILIPFILLGILTARFMMNHADSIQMINAIFQVVILFVMIPYLYFVYKWMVNINFKGYHISWDTDFLASSSKMVIEIFLSVITLGIYAPLAMVKLYKYFVERTAVAGTENTRYFGYDIEPKDDFLFLWKQILLTVISLGIYYPWAACNIGKLMLGKTYLNNTLGDVDRAHDTLVIEPAS